MIARDLETNFLFELQRQYPKDEIRLPGYEEKCYKINLSTRTIDSPEFLSIEKDHNSEVKYFVIDRYFDHKDLSTVACIIQYANAKGDQTIYVYDEKPCSHKMRNVIAEIERANIEVEFCIKCKKYYMKDVCKLICVYGRDGISLKSLKTFGISL